MLSTEQVIARNAGMFSTDAAPALGLSKYRTPVQVWLEKTGQAQPVDLSGNEAVQMGHVMEPVIARLYADKTGHELRYLGEYTGWHPEYQFMGSHYDYEVTGSHLVECKNFSANRRNEFGEEGSGDVPMDVLLQCIHEATVYQTDRVDVSVLFGGQQFCIFPVEVDETAKGKLRALEEEFWSKFVVPMKAPEPRTEEEARALFRKDLGTALTANTSLYTVVRRLHEIRDSIKGMETLETGLKAEIMGKLGGHSVLMSQEGNILATWKRAKDSQTFDKALFEKENPSIYARYVRITEGSRRFLLKD